MYPYCLPQRRMKAGLEKVVKRDPHLAPGPVLAGQSKK